MLPRSITINGFTATEFLPNSWQVTGPTGQNWYPQGSIDDITQYLTNIPPVNRPGANGPLIPSANVSPLPDGSTQIETLQQATANRNQRRANFEPDYIEPEEASLYTPSDYQALQQSILSWNDNLNHLRAMNNMSSLPDSAFDGTVKTSTAPKPRPWIPWLVGAGLAYLLFR